MLHLHSAANRAVVLMLSMRNLALRSAMVRRSRLLLLRYIRLHGSRKMNPPWCCIPQDLVHLHALLIHWENVVLLDCDNLPAQRTRPITYRMPPLHHTRCEACRPGRVRPGPISLLVAGRPPHQWGVELIQNLSEELLQSDPRLLHGRARWQRSCRGCRDC